MTRAKQWVGKLCFRVYLWSIGTDVVTYGVHTQIFQLCERIEAERWAEWLCDGRSAP